MRPSGAMMIEHRLIEKMIAIMREAAAAARREGAIDPVLVDAAVDFIRTYADRTHHGKEEDIFFRDLEEKHIGGRDAEVMRELIEEHKLGRQTVARLEAAKCDYLQGKPGALDELLAQIDKLTGFYPEHIRKEDEDFFPAAMKYFSKEEQAAMLAEFWEFDRRMIHDKYARLVAALAGGE